MPCRAMPCRAAPCHAVPCRAVPCHAVPCRAVTAPPAIIDLDPDPDADPDPWPLSGIQCGKPDVKIISNRAASMLAMDKFVAAAFDGQRCMEVDPDWWKGYWYRGQALMKVCVKEGMWTHAHEPHFLRRHLSYPTIHTMPCVALPSCILIFSLSPSFSLASRPRPRP